MTTTAIRLINLIMLMQSQPNQKAAGLARKLGISVRSLHRYMSMLDEMGIPVYTERGLYGGFSLVRGYKMPPLMLTPEEAVAVSLGTGLVQEMWGQVYREAAIHALAKLESVLPEEQRQEVAWARRALVATGLYRADIDAIAPVLEKLRRAVRELRQVNMLYQGSTRSEPERRTLDPYVLLHRWGWWYVIGFCHLRGELRSFRVDRILELSLTSSLFQVPADFDIQAYLANEMQAQPKVTIRLRFDPQAAYVAQANRSLWDAFEDQPDGSVVVTFSAPDLTWAASSVMAYGPIVTVLEPAELCQMVRGWAQSVMEKY